MQTTEEILDELHTYVAGRGHEKNFCYSQVYSLSSSVRCVDFSPWVGLRVLKNDILGLSVFKTQLEINMSVSTSIIFNVSDDGDVSEDESNDALRYSDDESDFSFNFRLEQNKEEVKATLQLPLENYFGGEIKLAKIDILTALLLGYPPNQFARIMTPYRLSFRNQTTYIENYAKRKKLNLELPPDLPTDSVFSEFQKELRKLPLATRLHAFDVLKYESFGKKPKLRLLSDMTVHETREVGIDENKSANILKQSKLINNLPDGTGSASPNYFEAMSTAISYADKMKPVYSEWVSDVGDLITR